MPTYDLLVIGGGSAGFNAARTAAALGQRVGVVDGARRLGGLCILRGCMPSKTLLYAAEILHHARHGADFGLKIPAALPDPQAIQGRTRRIIGGFADYRARQLKAGDFRLHRAAAHFVNPHTLALSDGTRLRADRFLIATGSQVQVPQLRGLREARCWTSDDVLKLDFVPRSILVLGGGVVACELAQLLRRLGSRVTMIQRSPHLLRDHSPAAADIVRAALEAEGVEIFTGTRVLSVARTAGGFSIRFRHGTRKVERRAEHCCNALGRTPASAGLGLDEAGVRTAPDGRILVNRWQQTSAAHIYAAGDCCGPVEIVHVAIQQGELAARHAAGVAGLKPVDFSLLLSVVFTDPALAAIGLTEAALTARKAPHISASYAFGDHGKAILMNACRGYVKVFAEPRRGRILGAEIVGPDAGELIHCFSGPLAMRATVFDLLRAPWYHPTLAEIITYPLEDIARAVTGEPG